MRGVTSWPIKRARNKANLHEHEQHPVVISPQCTLKPTDGPSAIAGVYEQWALLAFQQTRAHRLIFGKCERLSQDLRTLRIHRILEFAEREDWPGWEAPLSRLSFSRGRPGAGHGSNVRGNLALLRVAAFAALDYGSLVMLLLVLISQP